MTTEQLYAELRILAPSVVFSARAEEDVSFEWDGYGDEPEDMEPHNVEIRAEAVHAGRLVSGSAYLGGHYMRYNEKPGDVGGYLPQLLQEAAEELKETVCDPDVISQLDAVDAFLAREMRARYDEQRAELNRA